ncbi:MAG: hypothetical protein IJ405_01195 [Lachnospiraceae bacterium]|nr:hypothetical protein [Lachnospiraceae bacterium]MBQ7780627.1 hypothetical protein [Lachnospiraceae bacterium]
MKDFCYVVGCIVMVLGVIGSIVLAASLGVEVSYSHYGTLREERNWLLTIVWFGVGVLSTAVVSSILFALSEVLGYLARINNKLTSSDINSVIDSMKLVEGSEWRCSRCGRINNKAVGTCACGQSRE